MGDCHARFCERLELQCSGLLDSFFANLSSVQKVVGIIWEIRFLNKFESSLKWDLKGFNYN